SVLNVARLQNLRPYLPFLDEKTFAIVNSNLGKDSTHAFLKANKKAEAECLRDIFKVANIDSLSFGCIISDTVLYFSFAMILGIVGLRFVFAVGFAAFIGWKLGDRKTRSGEEMMRRKTEMRHQQTLNRNRQNRDEQSRNQKVLSIANSMTNENPPIESVKSVNPIAINIESQPEISVSQIPLPMDSANEEYIEHICAENFETSPIQRKILIQEVDTDTYEVESDPVIMDPTRLHTIVMVPCYSEDTVSIKKTLDSVAHAYYPATHKVIVAIADGIVQGHGNLKTTPEILIDLMYVDEKFSSEDPRLGNEPKAYEYHAIAEGSMETNCAKVYAGWYRYDENGKKIKEKKMNKDIVNKRFSKTGAALQNRYSRRSVLHRKEGRVPMLLVVKCGNEEERDSGVAKPGNRGKRDSQILLMNFLSKAIFDDHMTELEFDLYHKLWTITGIPPDRFEALMCIDADTEIYPDSITHMVACLINDTNIMGLCGETRIANKWESWVTMIQVFEYYISHHLAKAFESVFGGVTCLPGCFSMYRIKSPVGNGNWIPIVVNPDIVEEYSENVVDTLHKKNLLLLGEDRLLTTLMLRTFPRR
ncbi:Chitin synthase, class 3, partial [Nowakowskiella sp. JEL0078]